MAKQLTLPFSTIRNADFLSNHWLEKRLPREPEWTSLDAASKTALSQISALWDEKKSLLPNYQDEAGLEQEFIQPIFAALGWKLKYQTFLQGRKPDYALFLNPQDHASAIHAGRTDPDFWKFPKLVADAKAWSVPLDRPSGTGAQREFPPEQIESYLTLSNLDYAILTNGQLWRLYPRIRASHQPRFTTFLEFNLAKILECYTQNHLDYDNNAEFFRFFLLLSPHAFAPAQNADTLIARAVAGSSAYRLSASEGLKDRVFKALALCIEGFLNHPPNHLDPQSDLQACRANAFTLLYRLLFIFFAEDRQLLPWHKNQLYTANRALSRFRNDIASTLDKIKLGQHPELSKTTADYWDDVAQLFDLIDTGKASYGVPAYNGGLFNTTSHPFLTANALPDYYLARVIDALGRAVDPDHPDAPPFSVDYKDLAIQDLGNIYEGLLELVPHYATQPMQLIRARRTPSGQRPEEKYIPAADPLPAGFQLAEPIALHEVYLATDKGERRASGSYYTPDHIVNYIVENTLGPLCRDIDQKLNAEIATAEAEAKGKRGAVREIHDQKLAQLRADFDDRILALKVLDPAMGSGHFLLRACQFLAEEIATNPHADHPDAPSGADAPVGRSASPNDESIIIFWKRKIVENCLYGVDLNPVAVELAKLALWLETVSTTQPLSFLDHHLRHGNSLVGAQVDQLGTLPGELALVQNTFQSQVAQKLPILLGTLQQIRALPSDTVPQVKNKEKLFLQTVESERKPFRLIADLWTSIFFTPPAAHISSADYSMLINALGNARAFAPVRNALAYQAAIDAIRAVHPFHWELEFPDVFFNPQGRLANPGFHAIIGNPPYDLLNDKETGDDFSSLRDFIQAQSHLRASLGGKNNLYKIFLCRAIFLASENARIGVITPMAILGDEAAAGVRSSILENTAIASIDAFPQKDDASRRVFPEAKLSTTVMVLRKTQDAAIRNIPFTARNHAANSFDESSPLLVLASDKIALYDPINLAIVTAAQVDWELATRITGSRRMIRLGQVAEFFQGEVNETNDRAKGHLVYEPAPGDQVERIFRGAGVCLYVPRPSSQGNELFLRVASFLEGKKLTSKAYHHRQRRIASQQISPQNNFRRLIACLIDAGTFVNNAMNYATETSCKIPIEIVAAILDSKLAEWYFRLGSSNAHVGHYQLYNLPFPIFASEKPQSDRSLFTAAKAAFDARDLQRVLALLGPACQSPPFPLAIQDIIIAAVERIIAIEQNRGEIARSERSHLDPKAQPYQDLIDQLFYRMAGLTPQESAALETRLATML